MRKLASIQEIAEINKIDGADNVSVATILGWSVVIANKDSFSVGDLVIFIEPDSLMPEKPEYEFLRQRKFRVRTIRLRGQVSQGLVLPMAVLPIKKAGYRYGEDVTEILGVRKHDPQGDIENRLAAEQASREKNKIKKFLSRYSWFRRLFAKNKRGGFPSFISKTDEERVQNLPHICEEEKRTLFDITEKIDGQSGTWFLVRHKGLFGTKYSFGVCSRRILLNRPDNSSYWQMAKKYAVEKVLRNLIGNESFVCLQGEICGPSIQGNKYGLKENDLWAFNLIYPSGKISTLLAKEILYREGIQFVPVLGVGFTLPKTVNELLEMANGFSALNPDVLREGIVIRNYEKNISFKAISPRFLLAHNE
jgi:hypothetical protein